MLQQIKSDMLAHFDAKLNHIQCSVNAMNDSLKSLGEQVGEFRVSSNQHNRPGGTSKDP